MVDVDIYVIGNQEYYLLDEIEIDGTHYLYLSKVNDEGDFMLRKRDKQDKDLLLPLDNEREVKMAALVFSNKMLQQ